MRTRAQRHEIEIEAAAADVFRLLHAPSAIRRWWGTSRAIVTAQKGGLWVAAWGENEDDPDFVTLATITEFEAPRRLTLRYDRYFAKSGPLPFEADFEVEFALLAQSANRVTVQVTQSGFPLGPEADPYYAGCEQGWIRTLQSLRDDARRGA